MAQIAEEMTADYVSNLKSLGVDQIDQMPRATQYMDEIIRFIEELIAQPFSGVRWLADEAGVETALAGPETALQGVIGPEGGFTERERRILVDGGFTPIRLGPLTMRFETAALAMAVVGGARRQEEQVV